jgi:hypothetical protein
MSDSYYTYALRLFVYLILLPLTGCIPVPIHHQVPAETEELDVPEHQFDRIVVAPYFHRAEINEFTEALTETDQAIEVIDAEKVFQVAFPDQDPNIEVVVGELLKPGIRERIRSSGIRFIVVLGPYETTRTEGDATFIGVYLHGSDVVSTKLMAGLVDLDNPESFEYLETRARGEDSATWIGPYLGLFVFGNIPETEESAIGGMAQQIVTHIRNVAAGKYVKIMVVAGNWESAMLSYKKEQALKALQEKAVQGDPDAQWKLYAEDPHENNLTWLCRAADQGNVNARNALGNLYYHGSEKYQKFKSSSIHASLPRSCMWFHLSGQAEITDLQATEKDRVLPQEYESPEVERTAMAMTEHELAEAEGLLLAWEPGQCYRDFKQFLGENYSKDPALAKLCTAADLGDFTSRDELGRIYFFGSRGVPEDAPRAYMWYRLAEEVYVPPSGTVTIMQSVCDAMTPEQHIAAKRLLEGWEPGQCEKELVPVNKQQ